MAEIPEPSISVPIEADSITSAYRALNQGRSLANRVPDALGVFGSTPTATAKYLRHFRNDRNYLETTARMYILTNKQMDLATEMTDDVTGRIVAVTAGTGGGITAGGYTGGAGLVAQENFAPGYIDFILQKASHRFTEKVQIVETLCDSYVAFFFGSAAPVFSYSGMLMNTFQDDWAMNMYRMYRDLARGSQLAKRGLLISLKYDSLIVSGAMVDYAWELDSASEIAVPFSFSLLVKKINIVLGGLSTPSVPQRTESFLKSESTAAQSDFIQAALYGVDLGLDEEGSDPEGVSGSSIENAPPQPVPVPEWAIEQQYAAGMTMDFNDPMTGAPRTMTPAEYNQMLDTWAWYNDMPPGGFPSPTPPPDPVGGKHKVPSTKKKAASNAQGPGGDLYTSGGGLGLGGFGK